MDTKVLASADFFEEGGPPICVHYNAQHGKSGLHQHEFIELVYIKHGAALHSHEGETQVLTTGDVFVILPGERHAYISTSNTALYNCLFTREAFAGAESLMGDMPGLRWLTAGRGERSTRVRAGLNDSQEILLILEKMTWEQLNRIEGWELKMRSLLYSLLVLYARLNSRLSASLHSHNANYKNVMAAVAFIEQSYRRDVPIEEIAAASGLSQGYLSRQFKSILGTSPSEYARSFRMAKAAEMLRTADRPISEVARDMGFSDVSVFSRQFKQVTGFTPSGFRKNI